MIIKKSWDKTSKNHGLKCTQNVRRNLTFGGVFFMQKYYNQKTTEIQEKEDKKP